MSLNYNNVEFLASYFEADKINMNMKPEIVFIGKSNVGKSSMINKLLNRKSLARVSETPGKTIAVNYYEIDKKVHFVDLPGYGYAKRPKTQRQSWGELIDDYFRLMRDVRLLIMLVDIRHNPTEDDLQMYKYLMSKEFLFCVVATKSDKLNVSEKKAAIENLNNFFEVEIIPFSSKDGNGVSHVKQIIEDVTITNYKKLN